MRSRTGNNHPRCNHARYTLIIGKPKRWPFATVHVAPRAPCEELMQAWGDNWGLGLRTCYFPLFHLHLSEFHLGPCISFNNPTVQKMKMPSLLSPRVLTIWQSALHFSTNRNPIGSWMCMWPCGLLAHSGNPKWSLTIRVVDQSTNQHIFFMVLTLVLRIFF